MTIKFEKKLYKLKAIKSAIKAYINLADFSVEPKKEYIQVILNSVQGGYKETIRDEFCNYVLYLMKSQ